MNKWKKYVPSTIILMDIIMYGQLNPHLTPEEQEYIAQTK